jgi:hypothetical protein
MELDNKLIYLSDEIKSLTALKKKLTEAKILGLQIAEQILQSYGIE